MSFSQLEINTLRLQGFSSVNISNSRNSYFNLNPEARNYAAEIMSEADSLDAFSQIETDFPRQVRISGKRVTPKDAKSKFIDFVGEDNAVAVARAYSQYLAEQAISPLLNLQLVRKKNFFSNLFKTHSNQIYFATSYHEFGVGGVNELTDKPNLDIPGKVLYIYAYNQDDGKFHLKYPLVSNDLLKELFEKDVQISPALKGKVEALKKAKQSKINATELISKIQHTFTRQELYLAARIGDLAKVSSLCGKKFTQKALNKAYTIADSSRHAEVALFLKKKGAKIDKRTAFYLAAEKSDASALRKLLKTYTIDINMPAKYSGNTALHFASNSGSQEVIKYLLACGAKINQVNKEGNSALHLAIQNGDLYATHILLQKGADINLKNNDGKTPFQIDCSIRNPALTRFMENYKKSFATAQKVYAIFDDIRALSYQYSGNNKQRIDTINNLLSNIKVIESQLANGEKTYDEVLQNLKDLILEASEKVISDHQKSSFAFFKIIKQNFTSSHLSKLLDKIKDTHKIESKSVSVKIKDDSYSPPSSP